VARRASSRAGITMDRLNVAHPCRYLALLALVAARTPNNCEPAEPDTSEIEDQPLRGGKGRKPTPDPIESGVHIGNGHTIRPM